VDVSLKQIEIIGIVEKELGRPSLGVVKQFLEIHEIQSDGKQPVILKVQQKKNENRILVYLAVVKQRFYFVLIIDRKTKKPDWAYTELYVSIDLWARSKKLTVEKMQKLTTIKFSKSYRKGEMISRSKTKLKENRITINAPQTPDAFENKLSKFIRRLEKDASGIRKLVSQADGGLGIGIDFHNGNGMLGGFSISPTLIRRLSSLGLDLNFDLYATGNRFK